MYNIIGQDLLLAFPASLAGLESPWNGWGRGRGGPMTRLRVHDRMTTVGKGDNPIGHYVGVKQR